MFRSWESDGDRWLKIRDDGSWHTATNDLADPGVQYFTSAKRICEVNRSVLSLGRTQDLSDTTKGRVVV